MLTEEQISRLQIINDNFIRYQPFAGEEFLDFVTEVVQENPEVIHELVKMIVTKSQ